MIDPLQERDVSILLRQLRAVQQYLYGHHRDAWDVVNGDVSAIVRRLMEMDARTGRRDPSLKKSSAKKKR